jgi:hypothetical protein
MMNAAGIVKDFDGRCIAVGWDCDLVVIGDYRFTPAQFGDLLAHAGRSLTEAAAWAEENRDDDGNEAEAALAVHETDGYDDPYEVF